MKIVFILFSGLVLGMSECSVFGVVSNHETKLPSTGWVKEKYTDHVYRYDYENVTVIMSLNQGCKGGVLLIGPPILPIIPLFGPTHCGDFCIQIQIESPNDASTFDPSNVRIELTGGKSYQVRDVYLSRKAENYLTLTCYSISEANREQIKIEKLEILNEKKHLWIYFDRPYKGMAEFSINIGSVSINGQHIPLPPP